MSGIANLPNQNSSTPLGFDSIPASQKQRMTSVGMEFDPSRRSGTFLLKDQATLHASSGQEEVDVLPVAHALKQIVWAKEHFWDLVDPETDLYTRQVAEEKPAGAFIRSRPGSCGQLPIQSCLYLSENTPTQNVHNLIQVQSGSSLEIINGCVSANPASGGMHNGVTEIFIEPGAKLTMTMIHNWGQKTRVRPRTKIRVGEGGTFISNYISLGKVGDLQMYPVAICEKNAVAVFNSIIYAPSGSQLDLGSKVLLNGPGSRGEITSRAVSSGGKIMARGHLAGNVKGVRGHLECRGLIMEEGGTIVAIPELEARVQDLDLSHEAAVGKIAPEEIYYLMARGVPETEAISAIVRGFLDVTIMGLPPALQTQVDQAISTCETNGS